MSIGAFGENFPYTNFHDLNMDWIIKIAKDFLDQYTHIQDIISQGIEDIDQHTQTGIDELDTKATLLTELLDQWYETHSEDIAQQLAESLSDLSTTIDTAYSELATRIDEKAEHTLETIPDDYSALAKTAQDTRESVIYNSIKLDTTDLFYKAGWVTGVLTNTGVVDSAQTDYKSTNFIEVEEGTTYLIKYPSYVSTYSLWRATYDSEQTLLTFNRINVTSEDRYYNVPSGTKYVRFSVGNTIYNNQITFRKVLDFFTGYNQFKRDYDYEAETYNIKNLVNDSTVIIGMKLQNNGTVTDGAGLNTTDFIEVEEGKRYETFLYNFESQFNLWRATYNENKQFISYAAITQTTPRRAWKVPSGVKYVRFTIGNGVYERGFTLYRIYNLKSILDNSIANSFSEYSYTGEEIDLNTPNKYHISLLFPIADDADSGETMQGFAMYNNTLFQFINPDKVRLYNIADCGEQIAELSGMFGHGNSATFSNTFYSESDEYPLVYVSDTNGNVYLTRITASGCTTIKVLYFGDSFGYAPQFAIDNENNIAYILGNRLNQDYMYSAYITKCDMSNLTDNGNGTYTPEVLDQFEVIFGTTDPAILQGVKYFNGKLIVPSGGYSTNYHSRIYFIDLLSEQITTEIRNLPEDPLLHELEDCEIWYDPVAKKNVMVIYVSTYGYYKMVF